MTAASTLEEKLSVLETAFTTGMAAQLNLPAANVVVQNTQINPIPDSNKVELVFSFYVIVPADKKVDDFQTSLTDISSGATELTAFTKSFEATMAENEITLTVDEDSIKVAAPVVTSVQVPKEKKKAKDDADEGGGGAVVIVVVVLVVLAVVGLVVWKFVLKK